MNINKQNIDSMRENSSEKILILGAGISGLAAADVLLKAGCHVTVLDQSGQCGGFHKSRNIKTYTYDIGSIFYEDNAQLFKLEPSVREKCPVACRVQKRISQDGVLLHYPLNAQEIFKWPMNLLFKASCDLLKGRLAANKNATLESICVNRLGGMFFRKTGLKDYIERFHGIESSKLDSDFYYSRMKFVENATRVSAILKSIYNFIVNKRKLPAAKAVLRVRPLEGFESIFKDIQSNLEVRGACFSMRERVDVLYRNKNGKYVIKTNKRTFEVDSVISTIPIDSIYRLLFGKPSGLRSMSMLTLFVSASKFEKTAGNVLFNFHTAGKWKRITIYSRLYPELKNGREFFSIEVTFLPSYMPDYNDVFLDAQSHLLSLGLASDLILEGHEVSKNCYPVYEVGYRRALREAVDSVRSMGVVSVGRQGKFEYLPTSSAVIKKVTKDLNSFASLSE